MAAVGLFQAYFSIDRDWILILVQIEIRSVIPFLKTQQEYCSLNALIRLTEYFPNRNQREISKPHSSPQLDLAFQSHCRIIRWSLTVIAVSCPHSQCRVCSEQNTFALNVEKHLFSIGRAQVLIGKFFIVVKKRKKMLDLFLPLPQKEEGTCFFIQVKQGRECQISTNTSSALLSLLPGEVSV